MRQFNNILDLIGRIFMSVIFIYEAYDSFAYYAVTKEKMVSYGITFIPEFWLIISLIFLCIGGFFLLIGYRAKFAGFLLLSYWFIITMVLHNWWADPVGSELRREESILFMKNISICGGLLILIVNGSGYYSVKRLLDRRRVNSSF